MFQVNSVHKDAHTVPRDCFISTENCSRSPFDIFLNSVLQFAQKCREHLFNCVRARVLLLFFFPAGPWNVHMTISVPAMFVWCATSSHSWANSLLLLGQTLMKFTTLTAFPFHQLLDAFSCSRGKRCPKAWKYLGLLSENLSQLELLFCSLTGKKMTWNFT